MPMAEHGHGLPAESAGPLADSAGVPWAGRQFAADGVANTDYADDDGTAPEHLLIALGRFRVDEVDASDVVDALRTSRLLIPLLATLAEAGVGAAGLTADKSAELSIVTVAGPDGRSVLPVFSSVSAMRLWNPAARPVPANAVRVALAAASEQTDLVVLDPTSPTEFAVRRPAVWAIAQSAPWVPSFVDPEVLEVFQSSIRSESTVSSIELASGDPDATLAGPELVVRLALVPGLDQLALGALLARLQERWSADPLIASRVDSLAVKLVPTS
ncbi:MAG: SseB family protein [Microbacteriaceae bacterium]|jgi:hypothetical protein|nr:SseB family protein [Microbacteriaceae bacterium]